MCHIIIGTHHAYSVNLILHQCYQRGYHNGRTLHEQSRQLIAQRLASSCGHQHKSILTLKHIPNDCFLVPFERIKTEIVL